MNVLIFLFLGLASRLALMADLNTNFKLNDFHP